jgi:hypothetical protein
MRRSTSDSENEAEPSGGGPGIHSRVRRPSRAQRAGAKSDDGAELLRRAQELAERPRRTEGDALEMTTLGRGDDAIRLYARHDVAGALLAVLDALPRALARAHEEAGDLRDELEKARAGLAAEAVPRAPGRSTPDPKATATLENVPVALVAPFHPTPRTLAAAKSDPLVALAVQATKAMQPDAQEIERARLLAMAFAASQGDMERFWAARRQRSAQPPPTPRGASARAPSRAPAGRHRSG